MQTKGRGARKSGSRLGWRCRSLERPAVQCRPGLGPAGKSRGREAAGSQGRAEEAGGPDARVDGALPAPPPSPRLHACTSGCRIPSELRPRGDRDPVLRPPESRRRLGEPPCRHAPSLFGIGGAAPLPQPSGAPRFPSHLPGSRQPRAGAPQLGSDPPGGAEWGSPAGASQTGGVIVGLRPWKEGCRLGPPSGRMLKSWGAGSGWGRGTRVPKVS